MCDICGRGSCCESFHSLEEQKRYEKVIEAFDRARELRQQVRDELDEEGVCFEIRPDQDGIGVIELHTPDDKSREYYGPVRFTTDKDIAIHLKTGTRYYNVTEAYYQAEERECAMIALDKAGVQRADDEGKPFSLWGRILRFKEMPSNAALTGAAHKD